MLNIFSKSVTKNHNKFLRTYLHLVEHFSTSFLGYLNLSTYLPVEFPQLLDAPGKRLRLLIDEQQGLKKLPKRLLDLSICWVTITSIFLFIQFKFHVLNVIIVFEID